jgi:antitoxin YefM
MYIRIMKVTSYSSLRQNLARCMDEVNEDHAPLLVTRANGKHAVMMSLEDFSSYEETRYLTASPANARRLREALAQAGRGEGVVFEDMDKLEALVKTTGPERQTSPE